MGGLLEDVQEELCAISAIYGDDAVDVDLDSGICTVRLSSGSASLTAGVLLPADYPAVSPPHLEVASTGMDDAVLDDCIAGLVESFSPGATPGGHTEGNVGCWCMPFACPRCPARALMMMSCHVQASPSFFNGSRRCGCAWRTGWRTNPRPAQGRAGTRQRRLATTLSPGASSLPRPTQRHRQAQTWA